MQIQKEKLILRLRERGFSENVLEAFRKIRREDFVPEHLYAYAYEDLALPLDDGSTISQPSTIAFMLELLELSEGQNVLEIGSGSGYALALISEIIGKGDVCGIEINKNLAVKSKVLLDSYSNIKVINRSGFSGLNEFAPYDRIIFSASCSDMRIPYNIIDQLKEGGVMVVPVKSSIFKIVKKDGKLEKKEFPGFSFVSFKED